MQKLLVVIGSHSEAIRAAPLVQCLQAVSSMQTFVCIAAQHCQLIAKELAIFGIHVDQELELRKRGAKSSLMHSVDRVIEKRRPDYVLVFGDSSMTMGTLCQQANFSNFGSGLRMYELHHCNPEDEKGRTIVVATRYFVHTETSRDELLTEGIAPENIFVTDSTEVDAVMMVAERIRSDDELKARLATDLSFLDPGKRLILISGQRHENHEACFEIMLRALKRLAARSDVQVVFPVHPDSKVKGIADETFVYHPNIMLIQPQDYLHYVYLIQSAFLILTDSGDTMKEVSSLNKPVLEMVDVSRCSKAADAVSVRSAELEAENILRECTLLLDDPFCYRAYSSRRNPYGDGYASQRIVETLLR